MVDSGSWSLAKPSILGQEFRKGNLGAVLESALKKDNLLVLFAGFWTATSFPQVLIVLLLHILSDHRYWRSAKVFERCAFVQNSVVSIHRKTRLHLSDSGKKAERARYSITWKPTAFFGSLCGSSRIIWSGSDKFGRNPSDSTSFTLKLLTKSVCVCDCFRVPYLSIPNYLDVSDSFWQLLNCIPSHAESSCEIYRSALEQFSNKGTILCLFIDLARLLVWQLGNRAKSVLSTVLTHSNFDFDVGDWRRVSETHITKPFGMTVVRWRSTS